MKIIFHTLFILLAHGCYGQDYLAYYHQINSARLLAVDGKYLEATSLYRETFEVYDFEFARDCIHAVEVSTFLAQDSVTAYFVSCALNRGVPLSYFQHSQQLAAFRTTAYWQELTNVAETLQQDYQARIRSDLRNEINEMFESDQQIRERYYRWSNFLFRPFIAQKWKNLNKTQVNRMIEITQEHGFPGEKLIGIDIPAYHPKIDDNQFSAGMPIVILLHHYSQPNVSFDSLLHAQVLTGNMNNEHFATTCDFEAEFGKGKHPNYGYYGFKHSPSGRFSDEFCSKRAAIGLLSNSQIQRINRSNIFTPFWNRLK